jgi:RNA polymerase sigma-70 factor (ECF subfamily)
MHKRGSAAIMTTIAGVWREPLDVTSLAGPASIDPQSEVLRLFADQGSALYRFCRMTLGGADEAEDIVQDTFLKLFQHLQAAGDRSNLKSWLFTVAANACRDRLRSRRRWLPWQAELDHRTVETADEAPDRRLARAAARGLPPRDLLLLSLRAEGLSYRDIGIATGIQERSVGRLLARAVDRWKHRVDTQRSKKA